MTELTKDQKSLVSLIRLIGYELPLAWLDSKRGFGFEVSGGIWVSYELLRPVESVTLYVNLTSATGITLRRLLITYHDSTNTYKYGTAPHIKGVGFDMSKGVVKGYNSEIEDYDLIEIVQSMPKSHAKAFRQALDKLPLRSHND